VIQKKGKGFGHGNVVNTNRHSANHGGSAQKKLGIETIKDGDTLESISGNT